MSDRLDQLLGVVALAAADRLLDGAGETPGLAEPEAAALVTLAAWPGSSVNDLARVVRRSQPATVRLVDRLVARGLVARGPGPDGRTVALTPTAAGHRAADAVLDARGAALAPLLDGLTARDRATLERLLGQVVTGLAEDRPGALATCRLCDRDACQSGPGCPLNHTVDDPARGRRHA